MNDEKMIEEINKMRKEKNIKILAHYYQNYEIQAIADYTGDVSYLSDIAKEMDCNSIVFCGVKSMAENIKTNCPTKEVVLPVEDAVCPMIEGIRYEDIVAFKEEHPNFTIVSHISNVEKIKNLSDEIVTYEKAYETINELKNTNILFIGSINFGNYLSKKIKDKLIITWNSFCNIHNKVTKEEVMFMKNKYPNAITAVHYECNEEVANIADFVGSAYEIVEFIKDIREKEITIGTETGILHTLRKLYPDKKFRLISPSLICYNMKKTTLEDVYNAVINKSGIKININ